MEISSHPSARRPAPGISTGTTPPRDARISAQRAHLLTIPLGIVCSCALLATMGRPSTTPARRHAPLATMLSIGPDSARPTALRSGTGTPITPQPPACGTAPSCPTCLPTPTRANATTSARVLGSQTTTLASAY